MAMLFQSKVDDPEAWRRALVKLMPDLDFRTWPEVGNRDEIDVALVWRPPPGELKRYPNLKAILSLGAGVDYFLNHADLPQGVPLARLVDPKLTQAMSEYVLFAVLRHHRHIDEFERLQQQRRWRTELPPETESRRVGVMGLGVLGRDAAARLASLGFRAAGWSRTPKQIDAIECFHGPDGLTPFLNRTEILVCLLPLTAATDGIIDARTLAALPEGAYVVNPARGHHVVDEDLLAALDRGHIGGATLDVFRDEPLPQDHPYWRHPKVLVTPHVASAGNPSSATPRVVDNIRRARAGAPLLDQVDLATGY